MKNLKAVIAALTLALCMMGCNRTEDSVISGTVSGCGGFEKTLGKKAAVEIVSDLNVKQMLSWEYDISSNALKIFHTGCFYNCAAELAIEAIKTANAIHLNEIDHRDDPDRKGKTESGCSCLFDFKVTIPEVYGDECTVILKNERYAISLKELSGSIEL